MKKKNKFESIKFPKDELAHNSITEWWYFNGHLEDKKHNRYSFMNCLFRADVKKLDAKKLKIPFLNQLPLKTPYFSHSVLSDIKRKKSYPVVNYISIVSKDSFSKPLLFINYTNPMIFAGYFNSVIERIGEFKYHIKTENIDLILTSTKKPLLEGGNIYAVLGSKNIHCYSFTNLKTEGTIKIGDKLIEVKGKSWMDHQWANTSRPVDKWTWFSIQLDNETEIVCFEYDDRKIKTLTASISYPDGRQEHSRGVKITPLGEKWTSPKTKIEYPLSWRIEIPSKGIDLEVAPLIKNQEIIFGIINYWEGGLTIKGVFNNKKVKGLGFLELVDHPSEWGHLKFAKSEASNVAQKFLSYIKSKTKKL